MMTPREYLEEIKRSDELIEAQTEELKRLRAKTEGLTSSGCIPARGAKSNQASFVPGLEAVAELEEQIAQEIASLAKQRGECLRKIIALKNREERLVLQLRYLQRLPWIEICRKMDISESKAYKIHENALEHFKVN